MASVNTNSPASRAARKAETPLTGGKVGTTKVRAATTTRTRKTTGEPRAAATVSPFGNITKAPDGRSFIPMGKYFAVLGESPTRARILWWLSQASVPVSAETFAATTRIKDAATHLAALGRAGLVNVEGKGTTAGYYLSGVGRMFAESIIRGLADGTNSG